MFTAASGVQHGLHSCEPCWLITSSYSKSEARHSKQEYKLNPFQVIVFGLLDERLMHALTLLQPLRAPQRTS